VPQLTFQLVGEGYQFEVYRGEATIVSSPLSKASDWRKQIGYKVAVSLWMVPQVMYFRAVTIYQYVAILQYDIVQYNSIHLP